MRDEKPGMCGSKGMIKTGSLKKRSKIGVKQQGMMHVQWNNLKEPFSKQLGLSIFQKKQFRYQLDLSGFSES